MLSWYSCQPMTWFVTEVESWKFKIPEAASFRLQSVAGNGASSDSEEDQGEPMVHLKICILIPCIYITFYWFGCEISKWDLKPSCTTDRQLVYSWCMG